MKSPERRGISLVNAGLRFLLVAICFAWLPFNASAGASAGFTVMATLASGSTQPPASVYCTSGPSKSTFGTVVTVVCETGSLVSIEAPRSAVPWTLLHGGAYRYTHIAENELPGGRYAGGVDSFSGPGTITSWRMVSLADRDYLEIQIGW